ncbi:hypothetical protein ASE36_21140 [Rhizobium sp. Root274]|uniref:Clp protease N-terminal domain-containing protein n=1 Tax=unclassified Rhizobium TaxID=2613769 RepID=UPI0007146924|nr:hypothetical protein ASC71_21200 [Rhizobium sp. Root1240]KRD26065.1 hypothetical protein ASE36_21140 [Rhizobium sp. Root274]
MFESLRTKFRSAKTITRLCKTAEAYALKDGQHDPGAEHFLLAALDLPDGTARMAFEELGADPRTVRSAIADQYRDALRAIGVEITEMPTPSEAAPLLSKDILFEAAPSGQEIIQKLAAKRHYHRPLLSAHIVSVVTDAPQGVAARALRKLGIDRDELRARAEAIAERWQSYQ